MWTTRMDKMTEWGVHVTELKLHRYLQHINNDLAGEAGNQLIYFEVSIT